MITTPFYSKMFMMKKLSILLSAMIFGTTINAEETDPVFRLLSNSEINFEAMWANPTHGTACVADFNEDGFPDLVVTGPCYEDTSMAYVNLLINQGGKSFKRFDIGLQAVSNGNMAVSRVSNKVYLLAVQGGTGVTATTQNAVGYVARINMRGTSPVVTKMQDLDYGLFKGGMMFVDYNGDGKDDLVCFGGNRKVYAYLNNGSNKFTLDTSANGLKGTNNGDCQLVDMNGDGRKDIVAIDQNTGFYVYLNNGDGTFTAQKVGATLRFKNSPRMGVSDFNGDGRQDIVAFDYSSVNGRYSVGFYWQNDDGTFTESVSDSLMGVDAAAVAVGDFTGDGNVDIVYAGRNTKVHQSDTENTTCAKAYMLTGDGKGNFTEHVKWNTPRNCPDIFCLAPVIDGRYYVADFDGDGRPDIFALGQLGVSMGGKNLRMADMFLSSKTYGFGSPLEKPAVSLSWQGFPYSQVKLGEGRLKRANDKEIKYLKSLDINRLFASTLSYNLGDNSYQSYGGSEESGYGSTFAHYTSAVSMAYAATGDEELLQRANRCVEIMRQSQDFNGDGFFAFKDGTTWGFDKLAKYKVVEPYGWDENGHPWGNNDIGIPLYAHHKIFAALRDAWLYTGNEEARIGFLKFSDWMCMWLQNFDDENLQKMLESEHGGFVEVLTDAYALSGKTKYLDAASRMMRRNFTDVLAEGKDDLAGRHANMHDPMVVGSAEYYLFTADETSHSTAHNFFDIVANHHSLANGGHNNNERFGTSDLPTYIMGMRSSESCASYNMLKLAKKLFCTEGNSAYMDYYENTLYNQMLGTLSTTEGEGVTYFTSLKPGTFRCYDDLYNSFWCCVGSGMETHTKYVDAIFFKSDNDVLVNLFTPATLNYEERGLQLTMTTSYPIESTVNVHVDTNESFNGDICFRYPSWATDGSMEITVNGVKQNISAHPGEIVRLNGTWKAGDDILLTLPPRFYLKDLQDDINVSAVFYGPLMLGAVLGSVDMKHVGISVPETDITDPTPEAYFPALNHSRADIESLFKLVDADSLMFTTVGLEKNYTLRPFCDIHDQRYNVYWKFADQTDTQTERTLVADHVIPGDTSNETAHNLVASDSGSGYASFSFWGPTYFYYRNASITGSFSYDMNLFDRTLADDENYYLEVTYFGSEPTGYGGFRIYIDGTSIILVQSISYLAPLDFAKRYYKIPRKLTDGKKKVTVKFADGRVSVYGLRILATNDFQKLSTSISVPTANDSTGSTISYLDNQITASADAPGMLSVYNAMGEMVDNRTVPAGTTTIAAPSVPGIYIVRLNGNASPASCKIAVQR